MIKNKFCEISILHNQSSLMLNVKVRESEHQLARKKLQTYDTNWALID